MFAPALVQTATHILADARARKLKIVTAESCTGGLIAALFTEIPGSSDVFDRGFVTYSNAAKEAMLGVPGRLIKAKGAVSAEVARAMAEGALTHAPADIVMAVTGIAGPGGGSAQKPVGLVHFAGARRGGLIIDEACRFGDLGRGAVRLASVERALSIIARLMAA